MLPFNRVTLGSGGTVGAQQNEDTQEQLNLLIYCLLTNTEDLL
jgi:hypothetical protein